MFFPLFDQHTCTQGCSLSLGGSIESSTHSACPPYAAPASVYFLVLWGLLRVQEQSVLLLSDRLEDLAPATSALLGLLFPLR